MFEKPRGYKSVNRVTRTRRWGAALVVPALIAVPLLVASPAGATTLSEAVASASALTYSAAPSPVITGSATVGSTLTAVTGAWMPAPTRFEYKWWSGGVAVPDQLSPTFPVRYADMGKKITVTVTAYASGYAPLSKSSQATPTVPTSPVAAPPTPLVGGNLLGISDSPSIPIFVDTSGIGLFRPADLTIFYELNRSGVWLPAPNGENFTGSTETAIVDGVQFGKTYDVRVRLQATVAGSTYIGAPSAVLSSGTVFGYQGAYVPVAKVNGDSVTFSWDLRQTLHGQKEGGSSWSFGDVSGPAATVGSVTLKPGYNVTRTFLLTSEGNGGDFTAFYSVTVTTGSPSATVVAGSPTLTGTAKVGQVLTVSPGTWGPGAVSLSIRWARDGVLISGATGKSYFVQSADLGKSLTAVVTGSRANYASATTVTVGTSPVATR